MSYSLPRREVYCLLFGSFSSPTSAATALSLRHLSASPAALELYTAANMTFDANKVRLQLSCPLDPPAHPLGAHLTFPTSQPNPSINREQVAPVLSEQGKQEGEMEKPGTEVYQSWAGDSSADARKEGAGKVSRRALSCSGVYSLTLSTFYSPKERPTPIRISSMRELRLPAMARRTGE